MKASEAEIAEILVLLRESPARIGVAVSNVSNTFLHERADNKSWSVNDILAHLRSCADVWGESIEAMLKLEMPTLPYVHPDDWLRQTEYREMDFGKSFKVFTSQRKKLLKILMKLSFKDWSRGAMIGGRVHTVFTQARRIAKHDTEHCKQIEGLLKRSG